MPDFQHVRPAGVFDRDRSCQKWHADAFPVAELEKKKNGKGTFVGGGPNRDAPRLVLRVQCTPFVAGIIIRSSARNRRWRMVHRFDVAGRPSAASSPARPSC